MKVTLVSQTLSQRLLLDTCHNRLRLRLRLWLRLQFRSKGLQWFPSMVFPKQCQQKFYRELFHQATFQNLSSFLTTSRKWSQKKNVTWHGWSSLLQSLPVWMTDHSFRSRFTFTERLMSKITLRIIRLDCEVDLVFFFLLFFLNKTHIVMQAVHILWITAWYFTVQHTRQLVSDPH